MNADYVLQARNFIKLYSGTGLLFWILRIFTAHNFIENKTPAWVVSCEFHTFFQPVILLKTKLQAICFIVNFKTVFIYFGRSLIKENYHNSRTSDDIAQLWLSNDSRFMKIFQKFKISIILEFIQTERKVVGGEEFPIE